MNNNFIGTIFFTLLILCSIWAIIFNFYMSWFRPSTFLDRARKGVKDWWPFVDFFKWYYGSSWWLWPSRITSSIFLFVILYIVYRVILVRLSILP